MNKKFLAVAIAAVMAAPLTVSAEAVMYGQVRVSVDHVKEDVTSVQFRNHHSRLGVRGSEDLGNGLKALYAMEFGVDIGGVGGANTLNNPAHEFGGGANLSNRNAFVGLAGNWGTLILGRHDTPLKISTGRLDYFADTVGDNNLYYTENLADRRANGTIAYITPSMGGLTIATAIVPGENDQARGLADAYSVAAMYSNSGFYGSAAIEGADKDIDALGGAADLEQIRFGLGYDSGTWKIGAVWENLELDYAAPGMGKGDWDAWAINGAYSFGNNTVKAKWFDAEHFRKGFALGLDHNLSKRTQAYIMYVDSDNRVSGEPDTRVWSVGMNHSF